MMQFNVSGCRGHDLYSGLPTFSLRNKQLQFLATYEIGLQRGLIDGEQSSFSNGEGRPLLKRSCKLFLLNICHVFVFHLFYVEILSIFVQTSGGESQRKGTGCIGNLYACRNLWGVWASESWSISLRRYFRNRCGE